MYTSKLSQDLQCTIKSTWDISIVEDSGFYILSAVPVAVPRGAPYGPKFSQFHAVFGKFGKIICWCPPEGLAPPPTGNPGSAPEYYVVAS